MGRWPPTPLGGGQEAVSFGARRQCIFQYTFLLASRSQPPGPPSTLICRRDRALALCSAYKLALIGWKRARSKGRAEKIAAIRPIGPVQRRRWRVSGQPAGGGQEFCRLGRSSSVYSSIPLPPHFALKSPWPSVKALRFDKFPQLWSSLQLPTNWLCIQGVDFDT